MVFGVTLISVLGVASIAPAFPGITAALGVPRADAAWLISMFTIPGLLFTPVTGLLSDRYGRRRVLIPCLFLFGAAGGACFFAPDFRTLLLLRFLQGIGSAPLNALNVTLIGDFFKGKDRSAAMGYNTSVIGIGTACYPAVGGLLAVIGWNYPFLLALMAVPVGTWALFGLREGRKAKDPARPARTFSASLLPGLKKRGTPLLFLISMATFIIQYGGFLTFLPFYLAGNFGATPVAIGLVSTSMSLSSAFVSPIAGHFYRRERGNLLLAAAFSLYAAALFFILHVPGCLGMAAPAILFGIGQGINIPTLLTMLTDRSPEGDRAMFLSINSMALRLGQTIGPLLFGIIFASLGIRAVFTTGGAMAVVMAVVIFIFLKEERVNRES